MIQSGDAAEQIVRMSLEGAEMAVKLTGAAAKEIAMFLLTALKSPEKNGKIKLKGKERLTSMLKSGKALEIFSIKERDLARFARGAKQYGIVYCVLRNSKNSPDGMCDVMVKADDAPKISRLVERFKFATVDKARIESEIVAEKSGRTEETRTDKPETGKPAGAEPKAPETMAAPDVADTERLLDDLLGTKDGKAEPPPVRPPEPSTPEPVKAGKEPVAKLPFVRNAPTPIPPPSEPTSESRRTPPEGTTAGKPSVKEELREITASRRKKKEPYVPKRLNTERSKIPPKAITHRPPPRGGKRKKSKGSR